MSRRATHAVPLEAPLLRRDPSLACTASNRTRVDVRRGGKSLALDNSDRRAGTKHISDIRLELCHTVRGLRARAR